MALQLAWAGIGLRRRGAAIALALFCLVLALPAGAAEKALHGVALVIGQSQYQDLPALTNPANDAKAIERLLSDLGFEVDLVANADRRKLAKSLTRFVEDAEGADVAMIYYSGHGIEAGGENFLVPVDADISALDRAGETLVPVSKLIAELQATVPVTIVLLDACRSNPFPAGAMVRLDAGAAPVPVAEGGLGTPRGVVSIAGADTKADGLGAVIGYAAAPGQVALDGDAGGNSPYAAALLKHLPASGFAFSDVMTMVTEEVYLKTGARQLPWTNASLRRLLYFGGSPDQDEDGDQALIRGERRKLLLTISTLGDIERQQVVAKARQDGVPMDALFAMLRAVGADTPEGSRAARQAARRPVGAAEVAARRAPDAGGQGSRDRAAVRPCQRGGRRRRAGNRDRLSRTGEGAGGGTFFDHRPGRRRSQGEAHRVCRRLRRQRRDLCAGL